MANLPLDEIVGKVAKWQRGVCHHCISIGSWRSGEVQDQLTEEILEHVEECLECKVEIVEVWELVQAIEPPGIYAHYAFHNQSHISRRNNF
jgi:glutamate synthase domain-containing protein 3